MAGALRVWEPTESIAPAPPSLVIAVLINGNSTVLTADVQAENGVVHIIDT